MLDARRAIAYVEANPEEEGKRRQHWSFVVPLVATMLRDIRSEDVQLRTVGGAVLDSHRTETRRKRRG